MWPHMVFCPTYIDDIVVYAHSFTELQQRLAEVFHRLLTANLKLKPSKVRLFQRQIKFLGHSVSAQASQWIIAI